MCFLSSLLCNLVHLLLLYILDDRLKLNWEDYVLAREALAGPAYMPSNPSTLVCDLCCHIRLLTRFRFYIDSSISSLLCFTITDTSLHTHSQRQFKRSIGEKGGCPISWEPQPTSFICCFSVRPHLLFNACSGLR